jgi:Ca-activated chloride channel family protein
MLKSGGGTEIYQGLEAGINEIRRNLDASHINHLILLTDGRTYGDEDSCLRLAKKAADEGISISGIGIGDEWNDEFLDKLVGTSGGNTVYISAPKDLRKHLNQKYANLSKVYAERVSLELVLNQNVLLQSAFRLFPEPGDLPLENPVRLGNIAYGKSLKILLEFLVKSLPQEKSEISLANGKIMMEIPSWAVPYSRLAVKFGREIRTGPISEAPHPSIVQAMSRLTLYRMQEKARQEVSAGKPGEASRHLQQLATHLLAQGERDLARTVLDEAEHVRQSKRFSSEGDKRIKYGTRSLLMLPGPREEAQ